MADAGSAITVQPQARGYTGVTPKTVKPVFTKVGNLPEENDNEYMVCQVPDPQPKEGARV